MGESVNPVQMAGYQQYISIAFVEQVTFLACNGRVKEWQMVKL